jgi:hypothetical protein
VLGQQVSPLIFRNTVRATERHHGVDHEEPLPCCWQWIAVVSELHEPLHDATELKVGVLHSDVPGPDSDKDVIVRQLDYFFPPSCAAKP